MAPIIQSIRYSQSIDHLSSHFHDCHQLLYIEEGQIRITIGEEHYTAVSGDLIIISRFEGHSIQIESSVYKRYTLRIRPDISGMENRLLSVLVNRPARFRHVLSLSGSQEVTLLLKQLMSEWTARQDFWDMQLDHLLYSLLICLYRQHPELKQFKSDMLLQIQAVQSYLEENYHHSCSLSELSNQFLLSASYLSHQFKHITGLSVMGYLTACRIAAAKRMLAQTDMDIGKIVAECGFSDSSNFSRKFRALTGLTPTQFREENKK